MTVDEQIALFMGGLITDQYELRQDNVTVCPWQGFTVTVYSGTGKSAAFGSFQWIPNNNTLTVNPSRNNRIIARLDKQKADRLTQLIETRLAASAQSQCCEAGCKCSCHRK